MPLRDCEISQPNHASSRLLTGAWGSDPMGMPTNPGHAPSLASAAVLGGFIAAVAAAAVVGIVLAVSLLTSPQGGHATVAAGTPFRVAQDIPTSFGYVAVEHAETVKGLTPKDLAGAMHGIGSLVARDKALVKASVTLRNGATGPLDYRLSQFTLRATNKDSTVRRYPVSHATVRDGTLQPDAALDAGLAFVIPRNGARIALEFRDPDRAEPVVVDLAAKSGTVTAAERRALRHRHG
jgi:hypothetical protein